MKINISLSELIEKLFKIENDSDDYYMPELFDDVRYIISKLEVTNDELIDLLKSSDSWVKTDWLLNMMDIPEDVLNKCSDIFEKRHWETIINKQNVSQEFIDKYSSNINKI